MNGSLSLSVLMHAVVVLPGECCVDQAKICRSPVITHSQYQPPSKNTKQALTQPGEHPDGEHPGRAPALAYFLLQLHQPHSHLHPGPAGYGRAWWLELCNAMMTYYVFPTSTLRKYPQYNASWNTYISCGRTCLPPLPTRNLLSTPRPG